MSIEKDILEQLGDGDLLASEREKLMVGRENLMQAREDTANERDSVAGDREKTASLREQVIQEAEIIKDVLINHMSQLRQANEQLVISTLQAQIMTEEVQKTRDQMRHMAHHDFLTSLPNRILLRERLIQALALAKRHGVKLAVLFLDLDRFKTINDSLGHAVGDLLLQSVAQRLMAFIRDTDTASRQGGDEFVILLSEVADEQAVAAFANDICEALSVPYQLAEQELHIGATVGISMYPDDGEDADTLIHNADVAMYHAKRSGRNCYHFFRQEMNARAVNRQKLESDLHSALKKTELEVYYQAQFELGSGRIIGAEALVRWHHPQHGLLLPAAFVPIAEESGVIVPMGRWVLHEACRQTQAWLDDGLELQMIAVNISAEEFCGEGFFDHVCSMLKDTGLAPPYLELELTETALMKNTESTMATLREFQAMGIRIAIDDFGTGYSSLSYLKQFPVDTLKIDQSFVAGIVSSQDGDALVDIVIALGKSLRHRVIAEGIETSAQLDFLNNHLCDLGQGNYLSPPMTAAEFTTMLTTPTPPAAFAGMPLRKAGVAADTAHGNLL